MAPRRNFLRRTKATAPPETTEASSTNTETTTNRYTRRGNSKFKLRKDAEKTVETNEIAQRPSLNGGARRYERPPPPATRKFVSRRRLGGANSTLPIPVSSTAATPVSTSTRRVNRIISRRRQSNIAATTNATTQATTKLIEDEESLQDIGDTDAIEDPSLEPRKGKASFKSQRRPLILKDQTSDQNPSATNDEENKRQSKKYSASIKQIQLDDLVKKSQEETSSEKKTEDISPETAVALAAHQLITAPVPIITDYEDDDVKPTRNGQTTVEYKYSSREYNEFTDTDSRTPTYDDYQSTPIFKTNSVGNDETTPYKTQIEFGTSKISGFDSTKTDFDDSKTTSEKYSTPEYKTVDYIQSTSSQSYGDDIDSSRITTYDVPKLTNTASTASNQDYSLTTSTDYSESDYKSPVVTAAAYTSKSPSTNTVKGRYFSTTDSDSYTTGPNDFDSTLLGYISESDYSDAVTKNYIRSNTGPETSTEFASRNSPSYVPTYASTTYSNQEKLTDTVLEENLPRGRISTTLSPPPASRQGFERTTLAESSARRPSAFTPRVTETTRLRNDIDREPNTATAGYSFIQRGSSRFRNDRLLPVPVDDSGYSTVGYSRASPDPSYFTRDYLLESPVTKTNDEEYQYIAPVTTTPTAPLTRRVIRKKIQRKISTTQRPTTPQPTTTTTVKPRRVPAKPFEKVSKVQNKTYRPIANYDYYDDSDEKVAVKYVEGTKVVMHDNGTIECLDIGNFPHPTSCKKFISCARIDNGSLLGWEYICPKGLSFDPVGGICNWSAGLGCNEKET